MGDCERDDLARLDEPTPREPPAGLELNQLVDRLEAEGDAEGWEAHLADLDDDGQDEVVFYCPVCAEREFRTTT